MPWETYTYTESYSYWETKSKEVYEGFEDIHIARPFFIYFKIEGLRPNTRHFFFFDSKNVTNYINTDAVNIDDYYNLPRNDSRRAPGEKYTSETGFPIELGGPTSEIYSSEQGAIEGVFYLQSNDTLSFPAGKRLFSCVDVSVLNLEEAISLSQQEFLIDGGIEIYRTEYYQVQRTGTRTRTETYWSEPYYAPPPPTNTCFIPGTKITTPQGKVNIEDIQIGDIVLGYNEETKNIVTNTVTNVHKIPVKMETMCTINNNITSTDSHLYYTKDGWKSVNPENSMYVYSSYNLKMGKLEVGDVIISFLENGEINEIEVTSIDIDRRFQQVHNFETDNTHTYIANDYVVHNKSPAPTDTGCSTPSDAPSDSGGSGGGGGGGSSLAPLVAFVAVVSVCCFIMLEARYGNGTMDEVVRRYRDEKMTDRNRRGYYKVAEVFVPLMRKSKLFKWIVTKTFADPLVSYGKWYYGENKHGWIFKPVEKFWMTVFDTVGGETKFIRENGEVV